MKTKKRHLLLLSLCAFPLVLFSQDDIDYKIFMGVALGHATLFRGELPPAYGVTAPTDGSTYYAYSDDYVRGSVRFRGKLYQDILLNLNAHIDELCVMEAFPGLAVLLNRNFVDSFSIGGAKLRQFVYYKQEKNSILNSGYYEVLFNGRLKLYKKIRKQYHERTALSFEASNTAQRSYILSEIFYVRKEEKWYRIATKGDIKKVFGEQKHTIDNLLKTKKINFRKNTEIALIEVVTYLNTVY